jgi:hypothetical protein
MKKSHACVNDFPIPGGLWPSILPGILAGECENLWAVGFPKLLLFLKFVIGAKRDTFFGVEC